jgi:hypothetical protein
MTLKQAIASLAVVCLAAALFYIWFGAKARKFCDDIDKMGDQ